MTNLFIAIGLLIGMIYRANNDFGKINNKKINYIHVGLMFFTVLMTSLSLTVLMRIALNFEATFKSMYIQNGFLTPIMNIVVLGTYTILSVIVLFTIFNVARRSENARKFLVSIIPILFIVASIRTINDMVARSEEISLPIAISLSIVFLTISYLPLFFFYKNGKVKNEIFKTSNIHKETSELTAQV